jgi:hypothetical protein
LLQKRHGDFAIGTADGRFGETQSGFALSDKEVA